MTGMGEIMHTEFWWRNLLKCSHLKDEEEMGGSNIMTDVRKAGSEEERWMELAQDHFQ
jgi:hypothetical protein